MKAGIFMNAVGYRLKPTKIQQNWQKKQEEEDFQPPARYC
jgi:hypothetical protein